MVQIYKFQMHKVKKSLKNYMSILYKYGKLKVKLMMVM